MRQDNIKYDRINILPKDGIVYYVGSVLSLQETELYYAKLLKNIHWDHDRMMLFGKLITTKRKVAWYGDKPFTYTYSKATKTALPWTEELRELKKITENMVGYQFNSCLLNLYDTGEEGMGWHSDDENELEKDGIISSLSLGAERKFSFKHKNTKQTVSIILETGSLLVMKGPTQSNWLHALPTTKKVKEARINLTFRNIRN